MRGRSLPSLIGRDKVREPLLTATGMRHGEALALRWRTSTWTPAGSRPAAVSASSAEGAGERLVEGTTKMGRSRVVDLDAGTVTALHAYRAAC